MFRKIIFITSLLMSMACSTYAQDYWVYIRTSDRSGVTQDDDKGRSKDGDIVQILPDSPQFKPSAEEKKEYLIMKMSNLTALEIASMIETADIKDVDGNVIEKGHMRKRKFDYKTLTTNTSGVIDKTTTDKRILLREVSDKTIMDFSRYEAKRIIYAYGIRPARQLANLVIPPAYAAGTITKTVNKTGEDYNTLTLWEDAQDGDLVTATEIHVAECYDDDGVLNDNVTIDGSTTNASYYMQITSPTGERHNGTFTAGTSGTGFRLNGAASTSLTLSDGYSLVSWIQVNNTGTGFDGYGIHYINASNSTVHNVIVVSTNKNPCFRFYSAYSCSLLNSIAMKRTNSGGTIAELRNGPTIYNSSFWGNDVAATGVQDIENNVTMKNCIVGGTTANDYTGSGTISYSISEDTSFSGKPNSYSSQTMTDIFTSVTSGSEDLHIKSSAVAVDSGTDLGTSPTNVQFDIDNYDRDTGGGAWDIGADEYVSAGPASHYNLLQGGSLITGGSLLR